MAFLKNAVIVLSACLFSQSVKAQSLPLVDLGYQVQQASSFNTTGQYYNFSNIRFAQAPVGGLRWKPPVAPTERNTTVNDGNHFGPICPQASPAWSATASQFAQSFILGRTATFNFSAAEALTSLQPAPAIDSRTSEDCLFLDVFTPKSIFETRNSISSSNKTSKGAPVLVWIYGGGYVGGSKGGTGNPSGLINASRSNNSEGVVFVAMNYRLGAFGWLAGPTFSSKGTQNVALYDQRAALDWVQQHIAKFGGDPRRVTVIGQSAGGGSIMHQITAYSGLKPVPFQQAIIESPGWLPAPSSNVQEQTFNDFLRLANVSSLEEARQLPTERLIAANAQQVRQARYGTYPYGPTAGGQFAPELPGKLLLEGAYAKDVKVMVGHNIFEGVYFTDPRTANETVFAASIRASYPGVQDPTVRTILDDLYPAYYGNSSDPAHPYGNSLIRSILLLTESIFTCNTVYLDRAFHNNTYAYQFSVFPSIHGQDNQYTFWNGETTQLGALPINTTIAKSMQEFFTSFAITGTPHSSTWGAKMGPYTNLDRELNLTTNGFYYERDNTANVRCSWWQKALYY